MKKKSPKKKKRTNGSRKGSAFEREICRQLSEWWQPGRDDIFWRTHGSGARATTRHKAGKRTAGQYGDIGASDPIGQPLIKCITFSLKRGYPGATLHDWLDSPADTISVWEKWIKEAKAAAKAADSLYWAIIAKRNGKIPIMVLPHRCIRSLYLDPIATIFNCVVSPFSDFVDYIKPEQIRELVE